MSYNELTTKERRELKKEFVVTDGSVIYHKANRIFKFSFLCMILSIMFLSFSLATQRGMMDYILDTFLSIFTFLCVWKTSQIKRKELNKFIKIKNVKAAEAEVVEKVKKATAKKPAAKKPTTKKTTVKKEITKAPAKKKATTKTTKSTK